MDYTLFLLMYTMFWKMSSSTNIRCYKCEPERLYFNTHIPLCQHFDASEQYIVECPYSTMCYKKETVLASLGLTTKSIQRGCALQTRDDEQQKINGKWEYVKKIHEVYKETCDEDPNGYGRSTKTTHCYCRGDLCNSAQRIASSLVIAPVAIMYVVGYKIGI